MLYVSLWGWHCPASLDRCCCCWVRTSIPDAVKRTISARSSRAIDPSKYRERIRRMEMRRDLSSRCQIILFWANSWKLKVESSAEKPSTTNRIPDLIPWNSSSRHATVASTTLHRELTRYSYSYSPCCRIDTLVLYAPTTNVRLVFSTSTGLGSFRASGVIWGVRDLVDELVDFFISSLFLVPSVWETNNLGMKSMCTWTARE